eukprot:366446-Chlamydomonas_euryale.AAC.4
MHACTCPHQPLACMPAPTASIWSPPGTAWLRKALMHACTCPHQPLACMPASAACMHARISRLHACPHQPLACMPASTANRPAPIACMPTP